MTIKVSFPWASCYLLIDLFKALSVLNLYWPTLVSRITCFTPLVIYIYIDLLQANHVLLEEIREINQRLIDTVVVISDEVVDPSALAAAGDGSDGTIVKCSFSAVALSPSLKSQYTSAQMVRIFDTNQVLHCLHNNLLSYSFIMIMQSPIQPLRLLVPTNYPNCSPILLDKFPVEVRLVYMGSLFCLSAVFLFLYSEKKIGSIFQNTKK